jgi:cytochrome P450 family 110
MRSVPVPKTPIFVQTTQWVLDPQGYMKNNVQRLGDIFRASVIWRGMQPLLFVSDPKAVQYMLTHDTGKEFTSPGELNEVLSPLLGRQNLILLSGAQHRNRRQLVMPPFHGDRLKAYGQLIQQITQDIMSELPLHEPLDVRHAMQKITMRVILQAVFGLHQGDRYSQLERLLHARLEMTSTPLSSAVLFWLQQDFGPWSPGARFQRLAAETDQLLFAEIQERRANPDRDRIDVLSLLLEARDELGQGLTDQDLRDELMTLLVAGHETTATALTWAIYWIHSLPDVKRSLLTELDGVPNPADPSQFLQLPYLTAVCNETLRIHPVAMLTFPRRVEIPLELCGHRLEPGDLVLGSIYMIHQREDLYPQPHQFRPERFLEREFSPYEFIPFGGGVRRCIGSALALYEMKIVLGTLLSQVELALLNKKPVRAARRGLTLGPNAPVKVQKLGARVVAKTPLEV